MPETRRLHRYSPFIQGDLLVPLWSWSEYFSQSWMEFATDPLTSYVPQERSVLNSSVREMYRKADVIRFTSCIRQWLMVPVRPSNRILVLSATSACNAELVGIGIVSWVVESSFQTLSFDTLQSSVQKLAIEAQATQLVPFLISLWNVFCELVELLQIQYSTLQRLCSGLCITKTSKNRFRLNGLFGVFQTCFNRDLVTIGE